MGKVDVAALVDVRTYGTRCFRTRRTPPGFHRAVFSLLVDFPTGRPAALPVCHTVCIPVAAGIDDTE